jgi:hypothetical protein
MLTACLPANMLGAGRFRPVETMLFILRIGAGEANRTPDPNLGNVRPLFNIGLFAGITASKPNEHRTNDSRTGENVLPRYSQAGQKYRHSQYEEGARVRLPSQSRSLQKIATSLGASLPQLASRPFR